MIPLTNRDRHATAPSIAVPAPAQHPDMTDMGGMRVQLRAMSHDDGARALSPNAPRAHGVAARGLRGASARLPHLDTLQSAFGHHDVSTVQAKIGGSAATACDGLGAMAYASGGQVAFGSSPDLHTAAHEAAHVVQQRAGLQLNDGLGRPGDRWERHADAVADAVVQGRSAAPLLDAVASGAGSSTSVQLRPHKKKKPRGEKDFNKGDEITSSASDVKTRGRMGVNTALTTARISGLQYAMQVKSVTQAFESYATPKVKAMDDGVSAKALFGAIAGVALGPLTSHIGGLIVDSIAKNTFNQGFNLLKGKLVTKGAAAMSDSKNRSALGKAIKRLVQDLDDGATLMMDHIEKDFRPRCNAAIAAINAGGDIEGDPKDIVLAFFDLTPDQVAETLAGYGLPTASTVKQLHLDLYRELVGAFEYQYVWAASSRTQKNAMSLADGGGMGFNHPPSTRRGIAKRRTDYAVGQRQKALDRK